MTDAIHDTPISLSQRVKSAVFWRSGSQLVSQLIMWASTFLVIRLLDPEDYGLFAMTQVVLVFLNLMNGYGFANALIRDESITPRQIEQAFGMLILLNAGLALTQFLLAPVAAAYFRQPLVADLLRVQALLYLATPFIALPQALLARALDFKHQAQVNLLAAFLGACTALGCATAGLGVWTLVIAALVLFWTQAIGMTLAAKTLVRPSFRFKGAGAMFRYGSAMVVVQFFWFAQSQADVFIAGRLVSPHELGLYTTALFLTQILAAKFIPPLNDVAFAAYARIQTEAGAVAFAFLKAVRLIMLVALPFYFGLAVAAEPVVLVMLGPKWADIIPLVSLLALAMPFMTLQILFSPATNAIGTPSISMRVSLTGALIMPIAFLIGVRYGITGLAWAWLIAFPLLTAATIKLSLPVIGIRLGELVRAILPGLLASSAMAGLVYWLDATLPSLGAPLRLMVLVGTGIATYGTLLLLFARPLVEEVRRLLRREPVATTA